MEITKETIDYALFHLKCHLKYMQDDMETWDYSQDIKAVRIAIYVLEEKRKELLNNE